MNTPIKPLPEKYVNPFTDYGFKRLFGEGPNKNLLKETVGKHRTIAL